LPAGISVFDAETDEELNAIAAAAPPGTLWAGTGGLAGALARADATVSAVLPRPVLGLCGSDQAATFAQLEACGPHWLRLAEQADLRAVEDALELGVALLSVELPPGLARDEAARRIGRTLHRAADALPRPGTLLVAGGETLRSLAIALGASFLEVEGRILPGLPRSVLRGGAWDGVTVVSKSGAFGPPGLLRDLLARNAFAFERER
jgi:uncharacterized protein YgbK (DUF1537 family)